MRIHEYLTLQNMEIFLDTQILQKFWKLSAETRQEVWWFFLFEEKKLQKEKNFVLLCIAHKNEIMSANNHQNVMKQKYVVNEYYAHLWFTSDDFLKNFRSPDENISKFHDIFMPRSKSFQNVIRNESETRWYLIRNIFWFNNILIIIHYSKLIFVIFYVFSSKKEKEKTCFFLQKSQKLT